MAKVSQFVRPKSTLNVKWYLTSSGVAAALTVMALCPILTQEAAVAETVKAHPRDTDQMVSSVSRPKGYRQTSSRRVTVDGTPARLVRHERVDGRNAGLGGEHVSWLHSNDGVLKGYVRMQQSLASGDLPTKQAAEDVALSFLRRAAPDLLDSIEIHWIAQHDESITLAEGATSMTATISGMKVKMRNAVDGRWFWVIVGTDGEPIVFERDIVWITMPGHRQTEKWLHDSWLAANATN